MDSFSPRRESSVLTVSAECGKPLKRLEVAAGHPHTQLKQVVNEVFVPFFALSRASRQAVANLSLAAERISDRDRHE